MDVRASMEAEIAKLSSEITEERQRMMRRIDNYRENEELDFTNATKSAQARVDQLRMDLRDLIAREALALAANHPLVGKKVSRSLYTRSYRIGGPEYTKEVQYGIIEVVTGETVQPQMKTGWRRLPIGTVAVRLLGANGAPRKTLERLQLREDARKSDQATNLQRDAEISPEDYEHWLERFWQVVE